MRRLPLFLAIPLLVAAWPTPAAAADEQAPAPEYSYDPGGRRDPFVSLINTGETKAVVPGKRPDGFSGLTVGDVSLRGVLQSRSQLLAMIQGPDKKTYVVHAGDKLLDGTIKTITPQALIIVQDVTDPLSVVKQREVRKALRSSEETKQ